MDSRNYPSFRMDDLSPSYTSRRTSCHVALETELQTALTIIKDWKRP
jgi:hypothetical protein